MVNRVKKTQSKKNPEGNTLNQNIYAWLMGQNNPEAKKTDKICI